MAQIPRLYLEGRFHPSALVAVSTAQAHYLRQVLRLEAGAALEVFNGQDGIWQARLQCQGKKDAALQLAAQTSQPQRAAPDIWLLCTPLRQNRLDWLVEKATELGVARICPMLTQRASIRQVNPERLRAIAMEAAEQCGRDAIPEIAPLRSLPEWLGDWPAGRPLLAADETGQGAPPSALLPGLPLPLALAIGPEGGWSPEEHALLGRQAFLRKISLGPRILRAETAAIAALAVILAQCGDWREPPRFGHPPHTP